MLAITIDGQPPVDYTGGLNKNLQIVLNPALAPGGNFDLTIWSLQLPIGSGTSPTIIPPSGLAGAGGYFDANYFYTAADGAMTFMDPQQGITTAGSTHCRTELREMTSTGSAAAWSWNGTNTMTVTGEVVQVGGGSGGHVTLGQVFNGSDDIPLCEFEYYADVGGFKVLYEETKGAGSSIDLSTPCALTTGYVFSLALSDGTLTVSVNGNPVYTRSPGISGKQFYFKCGCYDQTAIAGQPSTAPYTIVKIYALTVQHGTTASTITPFLQRQRAPFTEGSLRARGETAQIDLCGRVAGNVANGRKPATHHPGCYILKSTTVVTMGTVAGCH